MVHILVNVSERANRVLNIVKAKRGLKSKSEAMQQVLEEYENELEPEFKPEFVEELRRAEKEKRIKIDDIDRYFRY